MAASELDSLRTLRTEKEALGWYWGYLIRLRATCNRVTNEQLYRAARQNIRYWHGQLRGSEDWHRLASLLPRVIRDYWC
jgi:hypothetical protein